MPVDPEIRSLCDSRERGREEQIRAEKHASSLVRRTKSGCGTKPGSEGPARGGAWADRDPAPGKSGGGQRDPVSPGSKDYEPEQKKFVTPKDRTNNTDRPSPPDRRGGLYSIQEVPC
ncbi:MAG: hypothetical protein ACYCYP_13975 [Leptospirales bacterium]